MRGIAAVVLGCTLAAGASLPWVTPSAATYLTDERIPTDEDLYRDLERLSARYGEAPRFLSSRPLRRGEVLGYLDALSAAHADAANDPAYVRARREVDPEARGGHRAFITAQGDEGERFEISPYARFFYNDDPRNRPDVNRDHRVGAVGAAEFDSSIVVVADLYAGTSSQGGRGTPNFGTTNSWVEGVDVNSYVEESYAEARLGKLRALVGHTWVRWGPGLDGTLALSDAAPALDLLRGEFTAFHSWRLGWFVALLDPGYEKYLAGHRLEWSPKPSFTVGLNELARFDGNSQVMLYMTPIVPYPLWEKRPKSSPPGEIPGDTTGIAISKNNVLMSADVAWTPRPGWRTWGEFLLDDISFSNDYKPDLIGYQAGLEHRCAVRGGRDAIGATVEYNRVNNYTYSAFHGHYFEHEGFPTGFVLGPDVATLTGEVRYELGPAWQVAVRGEWRKKGEGHIGDYFDKPGGAKADANEYEGVVTKETRIGGEVAYAPNRMIRLSAGAGAGRSTNYMHVAGLDRDKTPITLRGEFRW